MIFGKIWRLSNHVSQFVITNVEDSSLQAALFLHIIILRYYLNPLTYFISNNIGSIPSHRLVGIAVLLFCGATFYACKQSANEKTVAAGDSIDHYKAYIRPIEGRNDSIDPQVAERGKVLIAYSDCYTCHTIDKRSKGPAFMDIARRYPRNKDYIELLAVKIIKGGSGAWGHPVMAPHEHLSPEHARLMAAYILSLKK